MSEEAQRVVVVQDASRGLSPSAIKWLLHGLSLKPGDQLTLLAILHQVNNPSTLSFTGAGKLLGYRSKIDSNSMFGPNKKIIMEEVARKLEEYQNNAEIIRISDQCETEKIEFHIEVHVGPSPKMVALKAVRNLKATWVILDRQMKKDKKYFMERLLCGISRMKRDNSIELLREPKGKGNTRQPTTQKNNIKIYFKYDEMIPGEAEDGPSPKKTPSPRRTSFVKEQGSDGGGAPPWKSNYIKSTSFSKSSSSDQLMMAAFSSSSLGNTATEASSSSFTEVKYFQEEGNTTNTEIETCSREQSPFSISESTQETGSPDDEQKQHNDWMGGWQQDEIFRNSICSICKNRRPKIGLNKDFTYAELEAATEGFSPINFLSEGGFGSVYKGELNGMKIAVKQHKNASFQGEKEFKSEVNVLSKARHENLVVLLGSCSEGSHRILVYEYVCNGSLDQHLSKHARRPLSWEKRMKIAMGAAKGLKYLHENNIIHRDMRPNNILVTHDHESLLGDFGLARTHEDADHSSETRVVGTLGYLAPEYAEFGKVSTKTDVYSFGVVLLQLITGLTTTDKILGGKSLVGWARPLLKEKNYPDLIDHRIIDSHDVHQLFWMVRVAEKCLSKDPQKRLTMEKIVEALSYIMEGKEIRCVADFSPAQSDSVSSIPDSSESPGDDGRNITTETTPLISFTTSTSSKSQNSGRPAPSPPIQSSGRSTIYGQATLGSAKNQDRKSNISKSRGVLYDEMII